MRIYDLKTLYPIRMIRIWGGGTIFVFVEDFFQIDKHERSAQTIFVFIALIRRKTGVHLVEKGTVIIAFHATDDIPIQWHFGRTGEIITELCRCFLSAH